MKHEKRAPHGTGMVLAAFIGGAIWIAVGIAIALIF